MDKTQILRGEFLPLGGKIVPACVHPQIVGIGVSPPLAHIPWLVSIRAKDGEPQSLTRQLLPFGLEGAPVCIDPQIMAVVTGPPAARPKPLAVDQICVEIDEPKTLVRQLLPFCTEIGP